MGTISLKELLSEAKKAEKKGKRREASGKYATVTRALMITSGGNWKKN